MTEWRVVGCDPRLVRSWDGDAVVFNTRSGMTHVLGAAAGECLFSLLDLGPTCEARLCEELAKRHDVPNDADLAALVHQSVMEMDELGLVEKITQ